MSTTEQRKNHAAARGWFNVLPSRPDGPRIIQLVKLRERPDDERDEGPGGTQTFGRVLALREDGSIVFGELSYWEPDEEESESFHMQWIDVQHSEWS